MDTVANIGASVFFTIFVVGMLLFYITKRILNNPRGTSGELGLVIIILIPTMLSLLLGAVCLVLKMFV